MKSLFASLAVLLALAGSAARGAPEIHGGRKVLPGEEIARFAVAVKHGKPDDGQYCSGALIARRTVLTAAHCIEGTIAVHFGVVAPDVPGRTPASIHIPPDYGREGFDFDLAILVLGEDAPEDYAPIAIADAAPEVAGPGAAGETEIEVAGYGLGDPGVLRTVSLGYAEKQSRYLRLENRLPVYGTDHGDSGGPAFFRRADGRYALVGALMGGNPKTALYTRLDAYRDWIGGFLE